ncbi:exported protein of unknown function [Cardinium endosymbiont cEper1 of Encarsia pergandiella]|uniref:hypothetical protein n=1 Tax=Cardinium endosymbiont of Encarsia pergandiella TaxID=249402 RepID=UPI00027EA19A|nr:hypothetical protein [Cardinium endosymbiont of Encarsia pergandiella]CCM10183.1 exported protein of unknown function [Cardinium endosymbiont cEper1 of Encarsia pergandiella]
MNKYKIKSIAFSALYGMAILNSGAASCSKEETKLKDLPKEELQKRMQEIEKELASREEAK